MVIAAHRWGLLGLLRDAVDSKPLRHVEPPCETSVCSARQSGPSGRRAAWIARPRDPLRGTGRATSRHERETAKVGISRTARTTGKPGMKKGRAGRFGTCSPSRSCLRRRPPYGGWRSRTARAPCGSTASHGSGDYSHWGHGHLRPAHVSPDRRLLRDAVPVDPEPSRVPIESERLLLKRLQRPCATSRRPTPLANRRHRRRIRYTRGQTPSRRWSATWSADVPIMVADLYTKDRGWPETWPSDREGVRSSHVHGPRQTTCHPFYTLRGQPGTPKSR